MGGRVITGGGVVLCVGLGSGVIAGVGVIFGSGDVLYGRIIMNISGGGTFWVEDPFRVVEMY